MNSNETLLRPSSDGSSLYFLLFFVSGFPALLYQIVWQRALFTLYGMNVEAVTMIVTVFMLGLGLGSLAGGWLSTRPGIRLLLAFGTIELLVGTFGFASLWLFQRIGSMTAGASTVLTGCVTFGLLLIPTLLMGSTLPLLVEHFSRRTQNVGESVGSLYFVNTLGAGAASYLAALFIMRSFGESGSVRLAVALNVVVGGCALALQSRSTPAVSLPLEEKTPVKQGTIPLWIGMLLAGATGFIALSYEILWYRLYSYTSEGRAACFAKLLAFYLFGIAYGSLAVRDACRKKLGNDISRTLATCGEVVVAGAIASFLLGPALGFWVLRFNYELSFIFVAIAAALLGAAFPLLSHAAIDPRHGVGRSLSYLYLSNIIGSALGSFIIGFVALDVMSTHSACVMLLVLGIAVSVVLAILAGPKGRKLGIVAGCMVAIALTVYSGSLFSGMYERLLFRGTYKSGQTLKSLVENRSGVIAVDQSDIVYGGGTYDGRFNTDLVHDSNMIYRAFAVAGLKTNLKDVLVIGLSSGSWAQVLANDPNVDSITIVEINPGYLPLIEQHPEVQSLLRNPKVHIVIDDGRRWLVAHPEQKFDFVLMNTTFSWRANTSNLLSTQFLRLVRRHLKPGGIEYYNTTSSNEAQATGANEFPYALRVGNFLAVSDRPIELNKKRWTTALTSYQIDGRPVFNLVNALDRDRLAQVVGIADQLESRNGLLESRESILLRTRNTQLITDDNMGTEWK